MSKNILITGVSRGLGLALCQQLLQEGHTIYGISRSKTKAMVTLHDQYPAHFHWFSADLSNPAILESIGFKNFVPTSVSLDGFVNNAASTDQSLVSDLQLDVLEQLFALNVLSPIMITRFVIRNMLLHRRGGSIVHISSVCAHTGYKGLSGYAATKGALEAFSKNTAREWGSRKIRSNCVVAGFMETTMSAGLDEKQKQKIYRRTALKQATDINAVVRATSFLLFDASSTTGQNIFVDAGTL
jgi:Dehydrogenases with different specificities (related to short-chain alcohol dehydrogenases)